MAREEAIMELKRFSGTTQLRLSANFWEALNTAIKALDQEPCEDAISKASVFEIMGNLMSIPYDFDRPITEKDVSESMDEIRALPPVTPVRPKGHWINIDKTHSKCDKCGAIFEIVSANGEANYCPNCGCLMSKGEKE